MSCEKAGLEVDVNTGLAPEELKKIIGEYDGLVIRSATKVTVDILEMAHKLKVVGRAGIGLDNVDIPAASQKGIVVMNAPDGNATTAAEHAISMMMALSRNIPQACMSMKEGKWEKKKVYGPGGHRQDLWRYRYRQDWWDCCQQGAGAENEDHCL